MIKKLLFASILTIFSVVSTMAQFNLFIRTADSLHYEWSKNRTSDAAWPYCKDASGNCIDKTTGTCQLNGNGDPSGCDFDGPPLDDNDGTIHNGFIWNNTQDSVGAVTSGGPYEGNTHYEFNYEFSGWWASGAWTFGPYYQNASSQWVAPAKDFSTYTHLKLYWKGFSAQTPKGLLTFQFSGKGSDNQNHSGAAVYVCDNSNTATYTEKIIPLSSFLNSGLDVLTSVDHITFAIADTSNTWWQFSGGTTGVFYLDAIQLVNIPDGIMVEGNGYATMPDSTYNFGNATVGGSGNANLFNISNVAATTLTLSGTPVISGTDAADFTVTTNPSSSIAAGASSSFTITFNPSSTGTKTAVLTISNNLSGGGSYVINLTGEGVTTTGVAHSKGSSDTYASYPSPFTDETVIKVNSTVNAPMSIKVMDTKGTVISNSEGHFTNEEITLGKGLEKGVYFVQASYQDRMQVIKIVKM
jgi:hypothetical protein